MKECETSNHQDGINIPVRSIGLVSAGALAILVVVFISGYFLGKKSALEKLGKTVERDSLADQIFVALCGVADCKEGPVTTELDDEVVDEQETSIPAREQISEPATQAENAIINVEEVASSHKSDVPGPVQEIAESSKDSNERYQAELIGFGTLQGAKRFTQRLEKKQIPVTVNKRVSKTARGRTVTWYQVVTGSYTDKDELVRLVNTIKQQERLNDVRIVAIT